MSRLPCPDQHVAQVPEADRDKCEPYTTLPAECAFTFCHHAATEEHHAVPKHFTRSWKERDYALLYGEVVPVKVPLCHACHVELTENRAKVVYTPESGFVWTWLTEGGKRSLEPSVLSDDAANLPLSVSPGQPCPYCGKRGDYPKKLTSPKTKPVSYRVPLDDVEEHRRILESAAQHLGTYEQPHWQFWTYALALASVLGDPMLAGAAKR